MSSGIYLIREDEQLVEMREQGYDSEARLQELLEKHPSLLAGDQMGDGTPRRWLLVRREAAVPSEEAGAARWSIDHLFLDQDAIPTLVEVKRSTDTRIRREVVGQMLDYAANAVVYCPAATLRADFEARCGRGGSDPEKVLRNALGENLETNEFWERVKINLEAGKIRLLFVADEIPMELRRVVEFLNEQMSTAEVLAVEIRQYVSTEGTTRTLVPRLLGQTARKTAAASSGGSWDETSFFDALRTTAEQRADGDRAIATSRRVLDWAKQQGLRVWWGKGKRSGSFFPMIHHHGVEHWTVSVWTYGTLEVQFEMLKERAPFRSEAKRLELVRRLNEVLPLPIPVDAINRRPSIPLGSLDESAVERFIQVLDWLVEETRRAGDDASGATRVERPTSDGSGGQAMVQ